MSGFPHIRIAWLWLAPPALGVSAACAVEATVSYNRDIRPILADHCFTCHGQDPGARKSKLRLDMREDASRGGESGDAALVPGKPEESELLKRLLTHDADEVMPPPKAKNPVKPAEIEKLRQWIAQGAEYQAHWAFISPSRTEPPKIELAGARVRNAIDAFVMARLAREGLAQSPEAAPEAVCRRMYLDLIGLPPTPQEVDEFLASVKVDEQQAVEQLTDKLLASPHYGERWARDWLDAARYADTNGFEKDAPRFAYFYRDWVINAFNRDLPYNQFIIEQLAGDQLPNPTQDQIVATGFLRNSMINEEGGVDPEQFRMEAMFDRMECIGKSVLGLTIQCAQCHSHKFDPITQKEYYQVFAFLNNDHETQPVVYSAEEQMKRAAILRQIGEAEAKLREQLPDWETRMAQWEDELKKQTPPTWVTVQPVVDDISTGGQRYLPQTDGSFRTGGYQPTKHEVIMTIKTDLKGITAFRLEALNDPNLPANGPGRSHLGTFGLTEFKVETAPASDPAAKKTAVKFVKALSDLEPPPETPVISNFNDKEPKHRVIGPASYAMDGNEETAWSNDLGPGRHNQECAAVFIASAPVRRWAAKAGRSSPLSSRKSTAAGTPTTSRRTTSAASVFQ